MVRYAIYVIASFLCLSHHAGASEKIKGAFDMTLGQTFDPEESTGKSELTDGTPMYAFSTPKGFRSFSRYYVLITPKTHKVYAIWGIGDIENTPKCKKEQIVIMELLKEKYGEEEDNLGLMASLSDAKFIYQGDRSIMTKCTGFMDVSIEIRYKDKRYEKLAEEERISMEVEKLDSSNL